MQNFVIKPRLDLAAGISRATVKRLRNGSGQISSLRKALEASLLDLKNLPPGPTWGARVATLRKRRGLSQNQLAKRAGVGRDAVITLEKRSTGRVAALGRILRALGTELAFRETAPGSFYKGPALSSARGDWRTPNWLLHKLYGIFEFDLDSAAATPPNVTARAHYAAADDGLFKPWSGCVFCNPPYGKGIGAWVAKCRREVENGRARVVVALLPARVGTRWWREHVVGSAAVVFLAGRLRFDDGENCAPFDAALVLWGAGDGEVAKVVAAFEGSWLALTTANGHSARHHSTTASATALTERSAVGYDRKANIR